MSCLIYGYAECRYAECCYAKCHYAERHYAECRYAECRGALKSTQLQFYKVNCGNFAEPQSKWNLHRNYIG